jgi:hypothetical protein
MREGALGGFFLYLFKFSQKKILLFHHEMGNKNTSSRVATPPELNGNSLKRSSSGLFQLIHFPISKSNVLTFFMS